jgi:hypothetical protein
MASHLHSAAMTEWGASGGPLRDTMPQGASGGQGQPQGGLPLPLPLAHASGSDWPWLEAAVQMAGQSCGCLPPAPSVPDGDRGAWATMPRVATRTPAPATRSIAAARAFTLRTMERWGVVARGADAAAVVTELMTNALRHALPQLPGESATLPAWPIRLGLADPGPYVICAVADPSADVPAPRHAHWHDEAGRGLLVVAALSDQWGYCAAPAHRGKVVWAAFATPPRSR